MEVPSVRKRQYMIRCMREKDNPDRNREGWEEDSESRRRKQQRSEAWGEGLGF